MRTFSTFDIVRLVGTPRERLFDWIARGFIEPSGGKAKGRGTKNVFTLRDLYGVVIFQALVDSGTAREKAAGYYLRWKSNPEDITESDIDMMSYLVFVTCPVGEGKQKKLGIRRLSGKPVYSLSKVDMIFLSDYNSEVIDHLLKGFPGWSEFKVLKLKDAFEQLKRRL